MSKPTVSFELEPVASAKSKNIVLIVSHVTDINITMVEESTFFFGRRKNRHRAVMNSIKTME